jgi:hypothetical protein
LRFELVAVLKGVGFVQSKLLIFMLEWYYRTLRESLSQEGKKQEQRFYEESMWEHKFLSPLMRSAIGQTSGQIVATKFYRRVSAHLKLRATLVRAQRLKEAA